MLVRLSKKKYLGFRACHPCVYGLDFAFVGEGCYGLRLLFKGKLAKDPLSDLFLGPDFSNECNPHGLVIPIEGVLV